jgi:hypothetical protein
MVMVSIDSNLRIKVIISYRITNKKVDFNNNNNNNMIFLPKIGFVKYRTKYSLTGLEDNVISKTVSRVVNKYFCALFFMCFCYLDLNDCKV